ncbi:PAC2 family protein [Candidatus Bathyarchaeota archaeon]|nr:PAC2 family protein [Candidatus Bathyarchaeota archaeon]
MEETIIKEFENPGLKDPILIEGFPGLGEVGRIAVQFLIKKLKAKKLAELYSPHFPHYVLVDDNGVARLLSGRFFFWKDKEGRHDIILLTGDSQAQTIDGQYEVTDKIIEFAKSKGVKLAISLGGYRAESKEGPEVIAISSSPSILELAYKAGAKASPEGNPVVGMAGLLVGLAKFKGIEALCILAKTKGYLPDPEASKKSLRVLANLLKIQVDLSDLDQEIEKAKKIMEKLKTLNEHRDKFIESLKRSERERMTYIS